MSLRRMIVSLALAAGLSLGLPQTMSAAYAVSAAPAVHPTAGVLTPARAVTVRPARPASERIPLIQFDNCTQYNKPNWVHLDILTGNGLEDWCFGFTGTYYFPGSHAVSYMCTGNNYGVFYYKIGRVVHTLRYSQGQAYGFPSNSTAYSIIIDGYSGRESCLT